MAPHPPSPTSSSSVQVVVRLRPLNEKEKKHGTLPVVSAKTADKSVTVIKGQGSRQARSSYKFDNVFTAFSSQEEVFEATLKPVIRDVMMGFESTVFAYGQTGTGKTHTMEGDLSDPEMHGVIPRSAKAIFEGLKHSEYMSHTVSCSFLEIYNEDLCDLLADPVKGNGKKTKLDIMEGKNGPFCRGLSETTVNSAEHVLSLMRVAQQQRQVGETNMNKQSSRSHCIFTMRVEAKRKLGDGSVLEVSGKLHCVDLAGSECAKSANLEKANECQGARERERMNINRSLLTLGRVVTMLKDQSTGKKKANVRIPYRDSKLTRILQESLGGRCKTCLIATVSPSVTAIEESMSTLNYAQAANGIVNKPITTSLMSHVGMTPSMSSEKMMGNNENTAGAVEHWHEMECRLQYMQTQVEEAQQALARKHLQQQELIEKAEIAETGREEAVAKYEEATSEIDLQKQQIQQHISEKEAISKHLSKTETALKETTAILEATQNTEVCLTKEANELIQVVKKSIEGGNGMFQVLQQKRDEEVKRREATNQFNNSVVATFDDILKSLASIDSFGKENCASLLNEAKSNRERQNGFLKQQQRTVARISEQVRITMSQLNSLIVDGSGIMPSVLSATTAVRDGLKTAEGIASNGEKSTLSSCEAIREQLSTSAIRLKGIEAGYAVVSDRVLETLSKNLMEAKENLSTMQESVSASLKKAKDERSKSRESLRGIVKNWESSSIDTAKKIKSLSHNQNQEVHGAFQMLTSEAQRLDTMDSQLSEQQCFLEKMNVEYLGDLQCQAELLTSQKETFATSHESTKQLCQQLMSNMMSGVQELLQSQIGLITKQHDESYSMFVSGNEVLKRNHHEVSGTATKIINQVASTNHALDEDLKVVRVNEKHFSHVLESTGSTLREIQAMVSEQEVETTSFKEEANESIQHNERMDVASVDEITKAINDDCETNSSILTSCHDTSQKDVGQLLDSATSSFAFVQNDVIESTSSKIVTHIETPSRDLSSQLRKSIENTRAHVLAGELKIQVIAKEHCNVAETMQDNVQSAGAEFKQHITHHKEDILNCEEQLRQVMEVQDKRMAEKLSDSSTNACAGKEATDDFTTNVIRATEKVPEIAERSVPGYSEKLTSTPSAHIILRAPSPKVAPMTEDETNKENVEGRMNDSDMTTCSDDAPVLRERGNDSSASQTKHESEVSKRRPGGETRRRESRIKRIRTER